MKKPVRTRNRILLALGVVAVGTLLAVFSWRNNFQNKEEQSPSLPTVSVPMEERVPAQKSQDRAPVVTQNLSVTITMNPPAAAPQDPREGEQFVTITRKQNWVSKYFLANREAVCDYNRLYHGLRNCNQVHLGDKIYYKPEIHGQPTSARQAAKSVAKIAKSTVSTKPHKAPKPQVKRSASATVKPLAQKARSITRVRISPRPMTQVTGPKPINVLNVAPYAPYRNRNMDDKILRSKGYTDAEIEEFHSLEKSGQCELQAFEAGTPMLWMAGARGKVVDGPEGLVANWKGFHSARVCTLSTGKRIGVFEICRNLTGFPELHPILPVPVVVTPPPEEPVVLPPAPPTREEPPTVIIQPPIPLEKDICESFDFKNVIGQRHEFPSYGSTAHSNYLQAALYCTRKVKGGTYGWGAMVHGANWHGSVGYGSGYYRGYYANVGFGQLYISDDLWDLQVGFPMIGRLSEDFSSGDYASFRRFWMLTAVVNANQFKDKLLGKTTLYETQESLVVGVPFARSVHHTWQGNEIADTAELRRMSLYANFAVREYLWRTWINTTVGNLEVYGELGGVLEIPGVKSGHADIGIALLRRCVGIGAGPEYDFLKHHPGAGWGPWADPPQCYRNVRTQVRAQQLIVEGTTHGNSFDESDLVPLPPASGGEPNSK